MNYLLKTNSGGRGKGPFSLWRAGGVLFVIVVALWWIFFTPTIFIKMGHSTARTLTSSESGIMGFFGDIFTYFQSKASLEKENEKLRDTIFAHNVELVNFELLKKQNNELKEALNRIQKTDLIAAAVIRSVKASPYDTFIVDGGKRAGIAPGDIVLVRSAVPIGYVSKVFDTSAEVTMYSAPGETIEGVLTFREGGTASRENVTGNATNAAGTPDSTDATDVSGATGANRGRTRTLFVTLTGKGGGNFEIILTKDIDVPSGAPIALPGLVPRILATVYGSETDAAGGPRVLQALSAVNMMHEAIVYIEPNHADE